MVIASYILLASIVLGINVIPAFMPPTWTVLAFFVFKYNLMIIPTVIIGATFATAGRLILASGARFVAKYLPRGSRENYESVGRYLNSNKKITIPLVITYAFLPIPSNDVFIAAGLAKVDLKLLAASFFVGRLISYTFWVSITHRFFADNLTDIFSRHYAKAGSILIEVLGLILLYFLGKIGWKKILKHANSAENS